MREYELEVLEQYDIEVRSTRKIRGAFFCDTDQGGLLLKEVHFSEKRAPLLSQCLPGRYTLSVETLVYRQGM